MTIHAYPDTGHATRLIGASAPGFGAGPGDEVAEGRPALENPSRYTLADKGVAPGVAAGQRGDGSRRRSRRDLRHQLRQLAADISVHPRFGKRIRGCGRPRFDEVGVVVGDGVAHFSGTIHCGSLLCPVCGPKIRDYWADRNNRGIDRHIRAGGSAWLVTPTIPHHAGMACDEGASAVMRAWSTLIKLTAWRSLKKRIGYVGFMRGFDITYGAWHGWNPHQHIVILTEGEATAETLADLWVTFGRLWGDVVEGMGYKRPGWLHGVDVRQISAGEDVGGYLAKGGWRAGQELARGDLKSAREGNRTPDEILADFMLFGDAADRQLRREYEKAMYARRQFEWSRGLAQRLDMGRVQKDEEIANAERGGQKVATITRQLHGELRSRCLLSAALTAAEEGGYQGLVAFVARAGYDTSAVKETRCPQPDGTEYEDIRCLM
jgi:hypothetical protein